MLLDKRISKLSKAYLFGRFKSIAMKLSDNVSKKVQDADYYCDAKHLSVDYQVTLSLCLSLSLFPSMLSNFF